jgi:hypothetical protein
VISYEVDKTVRHTKDEVGAVKRLSAAVVVNYRRAVGEGGAWHPLGEEALHQINALTREAMGFDPDRGDTLNVVNAPFNGEVAPGDVGADVPRPDRLDAAHQPGRHDAVGLRWRCVADGGWVARSVLRGWRWTDSQRASGSGGGAVPLPHPRRAARPICAP